MSIKLTQSTGYGNDMVKRIACNKNLAARAHDCGLPAFVTPNPGHDGPISDGLLATTMEAIIGAVWEDSHSFETVLSVLRALGLNSTDT